MVWTEESGYGQYKVVLLRAIASKNESLTERIGMVNQVVDAAFVTEEGLQSSLVHQYNLVLPREHQPFDILTRHLEESLQLATSSLPP